jgi:hypothetical protein
MVPGRRYSSNLQRVKLWYLRLDGSETGKVEETQSIMMVKIRKKNYKDK